MWKGVPRLGILPLCGTLPYYYDSDPSIVIGSHSCAGPLFDFDNGGTVSCAYSTPSSVLSTSNDCNVPVFNCPGCDSSKIRYFDYDADYYQIICESGLIQYTYYSRVRLPYLPEEEHVWC
ncbi:hypothetical protein PMAYCL1PPCAC_10225 [Pristionchus mayeri]|uniref:Uncharacterized protein n=1 Tax=Pristionchus mayeri TaxID=1317129 RepID=A0AAN4ZLW8_9BILA|nr:hypothetical protein PMAYCL1PPCAC_10225 [Pristionchus mayeri]